jgi:hypothetical protein
MLLNSGETHFEAEQRALNVAAMYDEDCSPFPYEGCGWLRCGFSDTNLENLIPHLDLWFMDICGIASRGKRLLRLNAEQLFAARGVASLGFFDQHPEYAWLQRHISQSNTPDLFDKLALCDHMRLELVTLFDFMLREALPDTSSGAAEQTVGRERRGRVSHDNWSGDA